MVEPMSRAHRCFSLVRSFDQDRCHRVQHLTDHGNNHSGFLTVAQGATVLVRLATLGADGPTAGFFSEECPVPW
jgi:hypothetical protein